MRETKGDILTIIKDGAYDAFCITTNGFVKASGECVMGRGIAQQCRDRFYGIDKVLGSKIKQFGNHVFILGNIRINKETVTLLLNDAMITVFSFPVKHVWYDNADINLIKQSCTELMKLIDEHKLNNVLLPRPGCGNGHLNWYDVKPVIAELLDDRVIVASF
jgi:hypothetical protein